MPPKQGKREIGPTCKANESIASAPIQRIQPRQYRRLNPSGSKTSPPVPRAMYAPSRRHLLFLGPCMLLLDLTPVPGAVYAPSRPHPHSWGCICSF
ncbi:hypothetical protein CEXT_89161 [Caerostris extrusa]|uniref:Uncharacterized protein n=1 Tax=Caerostris extrusa TaxID=172846 RepID=A0AAV4T2W1_CAEEX|nr:hypothetical protein CEXT_89161 [Caerostris extrusa]